LLHKHHERNQNEVDKSIGGCGNTTRNALGTPPQAQASPPAPSLQLPSIRDHKAGDLFAVKISKRIGGHREVVHFSNFEINLGVCKVTPFAQPPRKSASS
jgi:hypothetical protein